MRRTQSQVPGERAEAADQAPAREVTRMLRCGIVNEHDRDHPWSAITAMSTEPLEDQEGEFGEAVYVRQQPEGAAPLNRERSPGCLVDNRLPPGVGFAPREGLSIGPEPDWRLAGLRWMMDDRVSASSGPTAARIALAVALLVAGVTPAQAAELQGTLRLAYIDPATGSLIIQAVLGVLAATAVVTRTYWTKIKGWLGFATPKQAEDGDLASGGRSATPPNDG